MQNTVFRPNVPIRGIMEYQPIGGVKTVLELDDGFLTPVMDTSQKQFFLFEPYQMPGSGGVCSGPWVWSASVETSELGKVSKNCTRVKIL